MFKYVTLALLGVASASFGMRESTYLDAKKAAAKAPTDAQLKVGSDAAKTKFDAVTKARTAYDKAVALEANIKACKAHADADKALKDADKAAKAAPKDTALAKTAKDAKAALAKVVFPKGVDAAKCGSDKTLAKDKLTAASDAVKADKKKLGLSIAFADPGTVAALKTLVEGGDLVFNQLLLTPHAELAAEETALGKQEKFYKAVAKEAAKKANLKKAADLMEKTTKTMLTAVKAQNAFKKAAEQKAGEAALKTAGQAYQETCLSASAGLATALAEDVTDADVKGKLLGYAKQYKANKAAAQKANAAAGGSGGLTWLWIVLGLAIAGAGGYFLYTKMKKED